MRLAMQAERGECFGEMVANARTLVMVLTTLTIAGAACGPSSDRTSQSGEDWQNATRSGGSDFANTIGSNMIWVKPGTFVMGFQREQGESATPELLELERPREVKTERGFWISSTEVTVEQYKAVVGKVPSERQAGMRRESAESIPITNVSWRDALHFCELLSRVEGQRYRLPTTEEWEYACRGGAASSQEQRHTKEQLAEIAWFRENSGNRVHPVAQLRPNVLGLYDMQGNVFEWCMTMVPQQLLRGTPYQGQDCAFIRGGSYKNAKQSCDCGSAYGCEPLELRSPTLGFRIVLPFMPEGG